MAPLRDEFKKIIDTLPEDNFMEEMNDSDEQPFIPTLPNTIVIVDYDKNPKGSCFHDKAKNLEQLKTWIELTLDDRYESYEIDMGNQEIISGEMYFKDTLNDINIVVHHDIELELFQKIIKQFHE